MHRSIDRLLSLNLSHICEQKRSMFHDSQALCTYLPKNEMPLSKPIFHSTLKEGTGHRATQNKIIISYFYPIFIAACESRE